MTYDKSPDAFKTRVLMDESASVFMKLINHDAGHDGQAVEQIEYSEQKLDALEGTADSRLMDAWRETMAQIRLGNFSMSSWQDAPPSVACGMAEGYFYQSLMSPDRKVPSQLWVDPRSGEPLLWRKTLGENTALGLRALTSTSGLYLPAGTIYGIGYGEQTEQKGVVNDHMVTVHSYEGLKLYPARFSAFIARKGLLKRRDSTSSIEEFRREVDRLSIPKRSLAMRSYSRLRKVSKL